MKRFFSLALSSLLLSLSGSAYAQSGLRILPGSTFTVLPGTVLSVDSFVLTPSAPFILSGGQGGTLNALPLHPLNRPHIRRVFSFSGPAPLFSGSVTVYYRENELNGLAENGLVLHAYDGRAWQHFATGVTRDGTRNSVRTEGLSNFSLNEITLAGGEGSILPLLWVKSEAFRKNSVNEIRWTTSDEVNCRDFQVQRSLDARSWHDFQVVPARNTAGPNDYRVTDGAALPVSYYRIRQNDMDGHHSFSRVMLIVKEGVQSVLLYPNPVGNDLLNLQSNGEALLKTIRIYNAGGALVQSAVAANRQTQLNLQGLAAGVYRVVILLSDGHTVTISLVKQ